MYSPIESQENAIDVQVKEEVIQDDTGKDSDKASGHT